MTPLRAALLVALAACSRPAAPASTVEIPWGTWISATHTLTLDIGTFELVDIRANTSIRGSAARLPSDDYHYDLGVEAITEQRLNHPVDAITTAGIAWAPRVHHRVRIAASDDNRELDVCIERECLTLHAAPITPPPR